MKKYDYLIVGSGLFGATFAHLATKHEKRCLVIDKRNVAGGNIVNEYFEGICVHKYGPHIFHTNDEKIWNFVNKFVSFNNYIHTPVANYKDEIFNLPFNMNTFVKIWNDVATPFDAEKRIREQSLEMNGIIPKNLEEQAIKFVGRDIYEKLIKGYNEKQWGRKCEELPPSIIKRLPVRFTFNNNYFNDRFQGIPIEGYNILIQKLLSRIEVKTNCDFFNDRKRWESIANKIIFTGKIDEFYDYKFGKLNYRTVEFENEILPIKNFQGNAVVNYTDSKDFPFTRIIEHKHFNPESNLLHKNLTVISKEYSREWDEKLEPFYPINDEENENLYSKYFNLSKENNNIIFGGRLGEYKYYDMDDTIEKSFELAEKELKIKLF
jgi:UDP-galactopyranose mutase